MKRCGWNQTETAEILGVTQQSISVWVNQKREIPSPISALIDGLCAVLDILDESKHTYTFEVMEKNSFEIPTISVFTLSQVLKKFGFAMLLRLTVRDVCKTQGMCKQI